MGKIILVAILLLIALSVVIIRPSVEIDTDQRDRETGGRIKRRVSLTRIAWVPFVLALLFVLVTSWTQVHAKEEGVGVAFGRPVTSYSAGLHFKPFWQSVTKIDETVKTDSYGTSVKSGNSVTSDAALPVRLGDGNTATVATTIRWHVNPDAVDYIYATYRSNNPEDQLRTAVVDTQYQAVVNNVFSSFNPTSVIQDLNTKDPLKAVKALNFSPDYTALAGQINTQMNEAVKDADGTKLIVIDGITVARINYSSATETRISSLIQQAAKTQQAVLLQSTNQALATANSKLSSSLQGDDGVKVLVQQCLQDLAEGKIQNQPGFSCWPGSGSGVVIPGTK